MTETLQGVLTSIFRQFDSGYLIAYINPGGHKIVGTLPDPVIGDKPALESDNIIMKFTNPDL